MELRDKWYRADNGKHFVLTEKGKAECASFKYDTVGEPVSDFETEAVWWEVDDGYLIEVPIPGWCKRTEYAVMYMHNGYELNAGNGGQSFPTREIAEKYLKHCMARPWSHEDYYIKEVEKEGKPLHSMIIYNGKDVLNMDYYSGCDALEVGDYVASEIVDDLMNCLPPACMRSDCSQIGEPANHKEDSEGKVRPTYATFKRITEGIWEYCGDCFRGENVQNGKEFAYV